MATCLDHYSKIYIIYFCFCSTCYKIENSRNIHLSRVPYSGTPWDIYHFLGYGPRACTANFLLMSTSLMAQTGWLGANLSVLPPEWKVHSTTLMDLSRTHQHQHLLHPLHQHQQPLVILHLQKLAQHQSHYHLMRRRGTHWAHSRQNGTSEMLGPRVYWSTTSKTLLG